ncbi:hypothetical protein NZD89_09000 [Alicyclobacillus fastidiosus]|uniref:Uncharacterized protein n=1 Tax=Alicyclobacillus fastidiosus TaxID=392011 RepID=A0ABY6ZKN8_9BACL|nr:hypothetical protein [Alicyclobacillus fastidiosus]WAH43498.1 hypothetical protein NZD89_09000 [Alicyclobacillus fastidiosus]GMA59658.1 hypothetical protein GCM10025859_00980 [Alicyclobacillus fastidiosus]
MTEARMSEKILPAFRGPWKEVRKGEHLYYVLTGDRNSSKSTHISIMLVYDIMRYPINVLCLRK